MLALNKIIVFLQTHFRIDVVQDMTQFLKLHWCGFKVSVEYTQTEEIFPVGHTTHGQEPLVAFRYFTFADGLICRL